MAEALDAQALRVGDVQAVHLTGLDTLIVGSPTRAFSPTPAIKKWLRSLATNSLKGVKVAAFDTRVDVHEVDSKVLTGFVKVFGYAAKPMGDLLVKRGGDLRLPPEGFVVNDSEGPLRDGELERAAAWAKQLL